MEPWLVVLVTGSRFATRDRNWLTVSDALRRRCDPWPGRVLVVHGACQDREGNLLGVDALADWFADQSGYAKKTFPADWDRYGKAAGPIRNSEQVRACWQASQKGHEVYCYGFTAKNAPCPGTTNCISQAKSAGLTVIEIPLIVPYARHKKERSSAL